MIRSTRRAGLMLLLSSVLLLGCAHTAAPLQQQTEPFLMHVVLVWLQRPGNEADRAHIIEASQGLREIPGVQDLHVGVVVPGERDVVEDSFDVALSLRFADQAALQAYLVHPLHQQLVREQFLPVMQRYQVMDFAGRR